MSAVGPFNSSSNATRRLSGVFWYRPVDELVLSQCSQPTTALIIPNPEMRLFQPTALP
jgi:hypothetical protein